MLLRGACLILAACGGAPATTRAPFRAAAMPRASEDAPSDAARSVVADIHEAREKSAERLAATVMRPLADALATFEPRDRPRRAFDLGLDSPVAADVFAVGSPSCLRAPRRFCPARTFEASLTPRGPHDDPLALVGRLVDGNLHEIDAAVRLDFAPASDADLGGVVDAFVRTVTTALGAPTKADLGIDSAVLSYGDALSVEWTTRTSTATIHVLGDRSAARRLIEEDDAAGRAEAQAATLRWARARGGGSAPALTSTSACRTEHASWRFRRRPVRRRSKAGTGAGSSVRAPSSESDATKATGSLPAALKTEKK